MYNFLLQPSISLYKLKSKYFVQKADLHFDLPAACDSYLKTSDKFCHRK